MWTACRFGLDYRFPLSGPDKLWRSRQLPLNHKYNTFIDVCQAFRCLFGSDELVPHAHRPVATGRPRITVSQLSEQPKYNTFIQVCQAFRCLFGIGQKGKNGATNDNRGGPMPGVCCRLSSIRRRSTYRPLSHARAADLSPIGCIPKSGCRPSMRLQRWIRLCRSAQPSTINITHLYEFVKPQLTQV